MSKYDPNHPGMCDISRAIVAAHNGYGAPRPEELLVAIEFPEDDSYFLGGPYRHEGKFYGLVTLSHHPEALPQDEILAEFRERMLDSSSDTYMPYSAREKLRKAYPDGMDFYYDAQTKTSFSELDLKVGGDEISQEQRNRLECTSKCSPFFRTNRARAHIREMLTDSELSDWAENREQAASRVVEESRLTVPCKELPYKVYLFGTDDASFTAIRKTEAEVEALLDDLRSRGSIVVHEKMRFTN